MQVYAVLAGRWGRRKQDQEGRAAVQLGGTNDCSSAARQGAAKEATGFPLGRHSLRIQLMCADHAFLKKGGYNSIFLKSLRQFEVYFCHKLLLRASK